MVRVGVIGVGHLGKEHARIYHELPEAHLIGICDKDASKKERADILGTAFFKDHKALFGQVDAVSIATPTAEHFKVARDFLSRGIHTLIEKPITLKVEDADELIDLAVKNNCYLQVGHIERHNPGYKRVEEIAKNIRFMEIHRLGPFTGRINDCGVVLDLMIHDIDIVLGLVKSEILSYDAIGINVLTPYEDIANVRIKFKNGAVVDMTASRLSPEKQRKIRIFQEDAYISLDYGEQKAKIFRKKFLQIAQEEIDIEKSEPLKDELKYFLSQISTGKGLGKPDTAARDALKLAVEIVETIQKNQKEFQVLSKNAR
ncbi:MAG: Gfo/Idh/MocA family oxidoreductase [Candidatus Omnitrophica bacterium]|nr:Gfo/Idh/MocA family oxidoreductase [Candidatus Omnitrophota bacterium]